MAFKIVIMLIVLIVLLLYFISIILYNIDNELEKINRFYIYQYWLNCHIESVHQDESFNKEPKGENER